MPTPRPRIVEHREHFGEAVIAEAGLGTFDASFDAQLPDACGINVKVGRLGVLEKRKA